MKKLVAMIGLLLAVACSFPQSYTTTTTLNIRDTSSSQGHILTSIPSGTIIQPIRENNGWTKIRYKAFTGYISTKYIQANTSTNGNQQTNANTNPPKSDVHYYTNVDGNNVQAPTRYDSPPQGATAQCNDGTYSFSQHARGTCSHHGGVRKWLH